MTQRPLPSHEEWAAGAAQRRERHARQTRERAERKQLERERKRLVSLDTDPEWIERVLGGDGAA